MSRTVTLVAPDGTVLGQQDVVAAHSEGGSLHLACSAVVFGPNNTVLLQQRAHHKPTFGGLWSNACCTHPFAGELPHVAARRRLQEELGFDVPLTPAGSFRYRAIDQHTHMVEHELDHVSIGSVASTELPAKLDPNEVASVAFVALTDLHTMALTPWFDMVMRIAVSAWQSEMA
jgi:isopentenyl-diphosphate Delta-isomerase